VGQKTVLKYHHKVVEAPIGIQPFFRRSGHIHPLRTPAGRAVTDDFPRDHPHQHGIFFAWVNTSYAGHLVDFWNQGGQTGQVEHVAIEQTVEGPVCAEFRARLRHSDINFGTTKPVLDETWTVRVYNFEQYFLVDLTSSQQCIAAPLIVNEYHYGGMALRGQRQWYDQRARENQRADREEGEQEFVFITSEGKDRIAGNHTRPRWVSLSGPVDGQFASVTVMGHPTNFRYPQPVRLHPTKPYFCFAPMVLGEFPLDQARAYVSRYRFFVHDGRLDQEANLRSWKDFAEPPTVRVVTAD
jgi:hypothetical protein